jgi:RND family efflux transporter MFP subunit
MLTIPIQKTAVRGFLALLAASLWFTTSCSTGEVQAGTVGGPDVPTVAVASVVTANLSSDLVLTAEFKPFQEVEVMAKVAGYVKQINVDVGDRVTQDQVLATLEIPEMLDDLTRANAAVERSQAEVAHANDEIQRTQAAHQFSHLSYTRLAGVSKQRPGLVAQQEIDDAQSKDLMSEAQVSAAKSALAVAKEQVEVNQAEVEKVHAMLQYTKVVAPFTGVVTKRYADTGSMIQAGTASQTQAMPLVQVSENSLLRLVVPVPESTVPTIHIGQEVEVRVPTLRRSFPGRVVRFADKVSLTTRTMDTEIDVPNPSLVLIPGMYAEVNLKLDRRNAVLVIPVIAVDRDGDASGRVMVVTLNNRVEFRKVAIGLETAESVEVRSGLNEADRIVLTGRSALHPGQEVRPKITSLRAYAQ